MYTWVAMPRCVKTNQSLTLKLRNIKKIWQHKPTLFLYLMPGINYRDNLYNNVFHFERNTLVGTCPWRVCEMTNCRLSLNSLSRVTHICVSRLDHHWFRKWLVAWSAPSHYLNQCWNIVNWILRKKLQWNLNHNLYIFIQENAIENVVCQNVGHVD